jgi:protein TonB
MRTLLLLTFLLGMQFCNSQINNKDADQTQVPDTTVNDEDNNIYKSSEVDIKPDFPGGCNMLMKFILHNFNGTDSEMESGRILLTFIVEKDGKLSDIKAIRSKDNASIDSLVKVMSKSPLWLQGKIKEKPVRVLYTFPVTLNTQ